MNVEEETQTSQDFQHSWEPEIAKKIQEAVRDNTHNKPYMVAVVGIPGGGKSVSSFLLTHLLEQEQLKTMIMPHDGYHYPMDHLKMFPNPQDAIYRRGAPDTFDPLALKRALERIRNGPEDIVTVPGFDHAKGDPEPDAHMFDRNQHQVVLCEGLVSTIRHCHYLT